MTKKHDHIGIVVNMYNPKSDTSMMFLHNVDLISKKNSIYGPFDTSSELMEFAAFNNIKVQ
jgi:hypothetical protein